MDQLQEKIQEDQLEDTPEAPPEIAPEIIQEAVETGWRPEEEFKGDKTKWRPADEWVKRGRDFIPFIKVQNKSLKNELSNLKQTIEAQKKTTEKLVKMSTLVGEQAYERAKKELTEKQMAAVREGDVDAFTAIEKEKEDLKRPDPIVEEEQPVESTLFSNWHKNNSWYRKAGTSEGDEDLTMYADSFSYNYRAKNPNITDEELFQKTSEKVKEVFAYKFNNQQRQTPSPVDSGGVGGAQQDTNAKTFANLPSDAKAQCNAFIKDGTIKSKEQYVKDYYEV